MLGRSLPTPLSTNLKVSYSLRLSLNSTSSASELSVPKGYLWAPKLFCLLFCFLQIQFAFADTLQRYLTHLCVFTAPERVPHRY
jgi:hypothetical protein